MPQMSAGKRRHFVQLLKPPEGAPKPDSGGELEQSEYVMFAETYASIEAASGARLERFASVSTIASATHIVTIPFLSTVNIQTRVRYNGRRLDVLGLDDPEERHIELVLVCQEILDVGVASV